jgi:hypothetical protein
MSLESRYYYFDIGMAIGNIIGHSLVGADWIFDLEIFQPTRQWNRWDVNFEMLHLHEIDQTTFDYDVPAPF